MLDIKLIRENHKIVEKDLIKRGDDERIEFLHKLIRLDEDKRKLIHGVEQLKKERNVLTKEISEMKANGEDISKKLKEVSDIPARIKKMDDEVLTITEKCNEILMNLPNILHETVPVGKDDTENVEIRSWGLKREFNFIPKDHIDLGIKLGMIDIERAAKIAGARFYFLKGDLALLEMAIMKYAIDFMTKKRYVLTLAPSMMRRKPYEGVVPLGDFQDVLYKIEDEDLYMIATSEHPITSQFMDETLDLKDLPMKFVGFSTNFRKEAGSHGKDTKGIFRVHQFNKVEQIIFSDVLESWTLHEEMIRNAEEFFQSIEIPYRVVNICTGDIGMVASKKYDLEAWMPAQKKYREMVSCSNCTSYQARRLNIKYREKEGAAPFDFVHTLNSTVVTGRALVAIMENNQNEDGSIEVPKVLEPYMNGIKTIEKR